MQAKKANYTLHNILPGEAGIKQTLSTMRYLVLRFKRDPDIKHLAMRIVQNVPNQNFVKEAATLHKWVQQHIRYVKDPHGIEALHSAPETIRLGSGDCDDMSILLATMLEAVGHPTRFRAVGFNGARLSHVFPETKVGRGWATMECTKPLAFGEKLRGVTKIMTVHNK